MTRPVEGEVVRQVVTPREWGRKPDGADGSMRDFWFVHDRALEEEEWLKKVERVAALLDYHLHTKGATSAWAFAAIAAARAIDECAPYSERPTSDEGAKWVMGRPL